MLQNHYTYSTLIKLKSVVQMSPTLLLAVLMASVSIDAAVGEQLLSVSVHWLPINNDKIRFTYHLTWKQTPVKLCPVPNTAMRCAAYLGGTFHATMVLLHKWVGGYKWMCEEGCNPPRVAADLTQLYYKNISTFGDVAWESAVETSDIDFGGFYSEKVTLRFYRPDGAPIGNIGAVEFNRAMRQDTHRANIGPLVNVLPFYSVPMGEVVRLGIYPYDGDGDHVRCKWDMVVIPPSIQLDEDNCLIVIDTKSTGKFSPGQELQLSLYAEDYTCSPVQFGGDTGNFTTGPFSKAPFMMTVMIGEPVRNRSATTGLFYNDVGLDQNAVTLLNQPIKSFKTKFQVAHSNTRHYLSTGPRFMKFRANPQQTTVEAVWNVNNEPLMTGLHQACVMFYDNQGMPITDPRCVILFIGGEDNCRTQPCQEGEVCRSWYNHSTCSQTERGNTCNNDDFEVSDFLKQYLYYLIYAGSGVLGLLLLLLLLCLCLRCCCAAKENKPTNRNTRRMQVRPKYPDPDW